MRPMKISARRYEIFLLISVCAILSAADQNDTSLTGPLVDVSPQLREIPGPANPITLAQNLNGTIQVRLENILGVKLAGKLILLNPDGSRVREVALPEGEATIEHPSGNYDVHTYAIEDGVPYLVDIQEIAVRSGERTEVTVELLEGGSANRPIRAFDQDFDLALDLVELAAGTDPDDARSIPGQSSFDWPSPVLSEEGAWYRGELHAHSEHGRGEESVAELIKRAEKLGLDFLAITDRNTLAAALDPAFHSDSVVLIPAMEWGDDERGQALLYAPATFPEYTQNYAEAQAMAIRVQAQGGIFVIAHPNFPIGSWQWGLQYANGVEVWCRKWRGIPPMTLEQLNDRWTQRKDGKLIYSIAVAAATNSFSSEAQSALLQLLGVSANAQSYGISANAQSALFYDLELVRGMKAGVIAGSNSASPKVPLASPVTYVYGREKSLQGILEGLRRGRTFVSRDLDGPTIEFQADILVDGSIDVGMGGIIPVNRRSRLIVGIEGARGARMDILLNGYPIRSRPIESDRLYYSMEQQPDTFAVYRVRIVTAAEEYGFGPTELLAMSSPIYAQSYVVDDRAGEEGWIELENQYEDPRVWQRVLPTDAERYELKPILPSQP